jgi:hypothetical protein
MWISFTFSRVYATLAPKILGMIPKRVHCIVGGADEDCIAFDVPAQDITDTEGEKGKTRTRDL